MTITENIVLQYVLINYKIYRQIQKMFFDYLFGDKMVKREKIFYINHLFNTY